MLRYRRTSSRGSVLDKIRRFIYFLNCLDQLRDPHIPPFKTYRGVFP